MRYLLLIFTIATISLSGNAFANGFNYHQNQQPVRFYNNFGTYQGNATPNGSGYTLYNNFGTCTGQIRSNGNSGYNYYNQFGTQTGYSR